MEVKQVEVSVIQVGAPAPEMQPDHLRLQLEGCERPPVVQRLNCSDVYNMEEAAFTRGLKVLFIMILTVAAINSLVLTSTCDLTSRYDYCVEWWKTMAQPVLFVVVILVVKFVEKMLRRKGAGPVLKTARVQTI